MFELSVTRFTLLTAVMLFASFGAVLVVAALRGINSAERKPVSISVVSTVLLTVFSLTVSLVWSSTNSPNASATGIVTVKSKSTVNADGVIVQPISTDQVVLATTTTLAAALASSTSVKAAPPKTTTTVATHSTTPAQVAAAASGWPRVYDPAVPIDFTTVAGVTTEQAAHAQQLLTSTQAVLKHWASPSTAAMEGWRSIGDGGSGFEHYINYNLMNDGKFLDPHYPESLVYSVDPTTGARTLVSAMYIATPGTPLNDATLVNYAGPLIQWHVHNNLCWRIGPSGSPVVAGITDANGNCPAGTALGQTQSPMVHVWVAPNACGPFAAVEGVAAGVAAVPDAQRVDLCNSSH